MLNLGKGHQGGHRYVKMVKGYIHAEFHTSSLHRKKQTNKQQ